MPGGGCGRSAGDRGATPSCNGQPVKEEAPMPLVHVLLVLIVVGVLLWLVNTYIPMAGSIKSILNAVVVIVVVLWLLNVFGLLDNLTKLRVGK
ncbi:Thivi_2564 family membrane protein [Geomonas subterranea]|nr:Thivi_2564 family membrane protein [Geomonas fuzhouensis]